MLVILGTEPQYSTPWVVNVNVPFFQVATLEFRHSAGAGIQGLALVQYSSRPKPMAS